MGICNKSKCQEFPMSVSNMDDGIRPRLIGFRFTDTYIKEILYFFARLLQPPSGCDYTFRGRMFVLKGVFLVSDPTVPPPPTSDCISTN